MTASIITNHVSRTIKRYLKRSSAQILLVFVCSCAIGLVCIVRGVSLEVVDENTDHGDAPNILVNERVPLVSLHDNHEKSHFSTTNSTTKRNDKVPMSTRLTRTNPAKVRLTDSPVFVFVLTRRTAFRIRQVIRETWAKGHDNVYFVMGGACEIPPAWRVDEASCERNETSVKLNPGIAEGYQTMVRNEQQEIQEEMEIYQDILLAEDLVDTYRTLAAKIKFAYQWGVQNLPKALWFVKVDDDMYVRVDRLVETTPARPDQFNVTHYGAAFRRQLPEKKSIIEIWQKQHGNIFDPREMAMVAGGHIVTNLKVHRQGKWKEFDEYKEDTYPIFPGGDAGHMISRKMAEYIAQNADKLFNYQGEDVSLGIWTSQAPMKVILWLDRRTLSSAAKVGNWCEKMPLKVIIGHKLGEQWIRRCYYYDTYNKTDYGGKEP